MTCSRLSSTILVFVIMTILIGCSPPAPTSPPETKPGLNLLIAADGEVLLKRAGWTEFHPTSFGAELHRGDQLKPGADANVVVLCEDLTTWIVPSGAPSGLNNGCPQGPEPVLVSGKSRIANTRGKAVWGIPYVISPRATKLLDPHPTLRWKSVDGATTYRLSIRETEWQAETDKTELKYPGDPALQPGVPYLLIVEADNGKSSEEEKEPGLGFSLLTEEEANRVRADVARIDALNLSGHAKAFTLAQLYAGRELYAEAIELLEESATTNPQAANVYRALGWLYQQLGLFTEADFAYREAVKIADSVGDLETGTTARAGLGEIYAKLRINDEAWIWLSEAKAGYKRLGDAQRAAEMEAQLIELNK